MALNSSGFQVGVLPQYTPVTQGLNFAGIVPGVQQGLGLVGQIQQQNRLRSIISDEEAARQELALAAPLRELSRNRQYGMLSEPIVTAESEMLGALPGEENGLGLYEVQNIYDPLTRQRSSVNQFKRTLQTPEQQATAAEDRALKQALTNSQITENEAQATARLRPPSATDPYSKLPRVRILQVPKGKKLVYQQFVLNETGDDYVPGKVLGDAPPRVAGGDDSFLQGLMGPGETATQEDILTPDEAVQLTAVQPARPVATQAPSVNFPAALARGARVPAVNGMPSFDTADQLNEALASGLVKVGDRVVVGGKSGTIK